MRVDPFGSNHETGPLNPSHASNSPSAGGDFWADLVRERARIDPEPGGGDPLRYTDARFAATHNSYEGGERGSIVEQLDRGVRSLEFDIHDNDFATHGYRIGHDGPGDAVAHGNGNPDSDALTEWLDIIADWSAANPGHAPITLYIDAKDNLDDNPDHAAGDLGRLGDVLQERFGDSLYTAAEADGDTLPTVDALRGKIVPVLSGDETSRLAYRRDRGENPAVAVDGQGRVVEVHDSGNGDLWYWAGQLQDDGSVQWQRHGRYDTGDDPAIAMNDDGLIVEVHEDPDAGDDQLWYRVGQLNDDFEIEWFNDGGLPFPNDDNGVNPSLRFTDRGGLSIREVHQSENSGENFYWNGEFNPQTRQIDWTREAGDSGATDDPLFDTGRDQAGEHTIEVSQGSIGPYGDDTLRYRTGDDWSPIRFDQVLFVEGQYNGSAALEGDDLWFFAADAASEDGRTWAEQRHADGRMARLWGYNSDEDTPVNFPAGDVLGDDYDTVK